MWDGRFEIAADRPGLVIEALRGQAARLDPRDRAILAQVPAAARPALPLWRNAGDFASPPRLALAAPHTHLECNGVRCRPLCEERLAAAAGATTTEAMLGTIARMVYLPLPPYVEAGSKD